jgi:predicted RNA-binding protein YlxR (DUF448 family)
VALGADGDLVVGKGPGRGAWLCAESVACLDEAGRRRAFNRALRAEVSGAAVGRLRAALQEHGKIRGSRMIENTQATERKG